MDDIRLLFDLLDKYVSNYPDKGMLYAKKNSNWVPYASRECKEISIKLAATFLRMGLNGKDYKPENQDKILFQGILLKNEIKLV